MPTKTVPNIKEMEAELQEVERALADAREEASKAHLRVDEAVAAYQATVPSLPPDATVRQRYAAIDGMNEQSEQRREALKKLRRANQRYEPFEARVQSLRQLQANLQVQISFAQEREKVEQRNAEDRRRLLSGDALPAGRRARAL